MSIIDYYKSLSIKDKTKFRNLVIERCDISYPSFQLKVHQDRWTKLEREAVEAIIEKEKLEDNVVGAN